MTDQEMSDPREHSLTPEEEAEVMLLKRITEGKGKPLDPWEVSALLETNGLRDLDARNDWGEPDIFSLAERLFRHVDSLKYEAAIKKDKTRPLLLRVLINYCKGAVFALPMLMQIVTMTIIGFGMWSYVNFSLRQATAIALGTLLALAVTGGISQMIGRKGLFFLKMGELILVSKVTKRLYVLGIFMTALWGLLSWLINTYFNLFPADMFQLYISYYLLLSLLFLSFSIFYMFEYFGTIALMVLLGIIVVYLAFTVFKIHIFSAQVISLIVTIIVSNLIILIKLLRIEKKSHSEGKRLPNVSSLFYSLYPYFIFGSAYFLFIIMDRALAWTSGRKFLPYFFWFNYPYEAGVDWALIPLIFTLALVEVFIYELGYLAFDKICRVPAPAVKRFNAYFGRIYKIAAIAFIVQGLFSIIAAFLFPFFVDKMGYGKNVLVFFDIVHIFVFICASIAYVLLSWSLLNCIVFFSYSRPEYALKSIGWALLTDFIVGYLGSRSLDYYYSVIGLLAGAVVFALFSTYYALRFFRSYHYHYYSSY
jgi:hypothetical protein